MVREKPGRTQSRTDPDADPRTDAEIEAGDGSETGAASVYEAEKAEAV